MSWYEKSVFYHIYPLGLVGAPELNDGGECSSRFELLFPWIEHIKNIGCNALYIGPLFQSVGHGYETTDYFKVDSRLGSNADFTRFVKACHDNGIRVIADGVFNHVGREFFAFKDLKQNRESSPYKDWFSGVNFWGNNEYNDGFSYANWGGYNLLVKLNHFNPAVREYLFNVVKFWISEFDIDGLRLDAADQLDFGFLKELRSRTSSLKQDFWLMGEVIHGEYHRWVNDEMLHSVTDYPLHKALYSGHNSHNYFEIAHTLNRICNMGLNKPGKPLLYSFVDNHDVERIYTKLTVKEHFKNVHIMLFTYPGIPSIYYGSEFGIDGKKTYGTDAPLRPKLNLDEITDKNHYAELISSLAKLRTSSRDLYAGEYKQLLLTNERYAYSRGDTIIAVNNADADFVFNVQANKKRYKGYLSGEEREAENGNLTAKVMGNDGEIFIPVSEG